MAGLVGGPGPGREVLRQHLTLAEGDALEQRFAVGGNADGHADPLVQERSGAVELEVVRGERAALEDLEAGALRPANLAGDDEAAVDGGTGWR